MKPKICIIFICLGLICGCGAWSTVPVTFQEVKNYVFGQQQSFSYPLSDVLGATASKLRQMEFIINRIEHFNQRGLVGANWQGTVVQVSFEAITPRLTKAKSKFWRENHSREFSSERALLKDVEATLQQNNPVNWNGMTSGMIRVHASPDKKSSVVAYLRPGVELTGVKKRDYGVR